LVKNINTIIYFSLWTSQQLLAIYNTDTNYHQNYLNHLTKIDTLNTHDHISALNDSDTPVCITQINEWCKQTTILYCSSWHHPICAWVYTQILQYYNLLWETKLFLLKLTWKLKKSHAHQLSGLTVAKQWHQV